MGVQKNLNIYNKHNYIIYDFLKKKLLKSGKLFKLISIFNKISLICKYKDINEFSLIYKTILCLLISINANSKKKLTNIVHYNEAVNKALLWLNIYIKKQSFNKNAFYYSFFMESITILKKNNNIIYNLKQNYINKILANKNLIQTINY